MTRPAELRRRFLLAFFKELRVVWLILSVLVSGQLLLGMVVDYLEG
jgi:hypothetical protein